MEDVVSVGVVGVIVEIVKLVPTVFLNYLPHKVSVVLFQSCLFVKLI